MLNITLPILFVEFLISSVYLTAGRSTMGDGRGGVAAFTRQSGNGIVMKGRCVTVPKTRDGIFVLNF